jgi:cytochrome d ubiquinol oxidase subunit I
VVATATGSWLSGYFILVTNAFMQHPVGYSVAADGSLGIASVTGYLLNPWCIVEFAHNQTAAVVTGSFVITAVAAFYTLRGLHPTQARLYLRAGSTVGLVASLLVAFPTGDQQAKMVGNHQPVTLAAMEGKFQGSTMAGVSMIGEPDVKDQRIDNPIEVPGSLSFLAYGTFQSYVHGLNEYPKDTWPDNIELPYHDYLGNDLHLPHGIHQLRGLARHIGVQAMAAVDLDAGISFSLHREHAGMDDRRTWSPAMAGLWTI